MPSRKLFVEKKEGLLLYFQSPYTRLWQYRASANTIRMVRGKKCDETDYSLLFLLLVARCPKIIIILLYYLSYYVIILLISAITFIILIILYF